MWTSIHSEGLHFQTKFNELGKLVLCINELKFDFRIDRIKYF